MPTIDFSAIGLPDADYVSAVSAVSPASQYATWASEIGVSDTGTDTALDGDDSAFGLLTFGASFFYTAQQEGHFASEGGLGFYPHAYPAPTTSASITLPNVSRMYSLADWADVLYTFHPETDCRSEDVKIRTANNVTIITGRIRAFSSETYRTDFAIRISAGSLKCVVNAIDEPIAHYIHKTEAGNVFVSQDLLLSQSAGTTHVVTITVQTGIKKTVKTIFSLNTVVKNTVKTTFSSLIQGIVKTTFNLNYAIRKVTVKTVFNLTQNIKNTVQTTFNLTTNIQNTVQTTFNIIANVKNTVKTLFSLNSLIKNTVQTLFSLTEQVKNTVKTTFDLNSITAVKNTVTTVLDLAPISTTAHLAMDATLTLDGQIVDILTANISQDEDSWTWAFNATIADHGNWVNVRPSNGNYPDVVLTVRGVSFNLMIEGMQRSRKMVNNTWSINGRGITARLDGKYAAGVETEWREVNAKAIIQELCDAASITLDYQDVDWQILEIIGDSRYPIEIINEIAGAIGAVVQTSTDGTLTIRPRYAVKPADYATTTPDFILTDADDYMSLDEQWLDRDNYNVVSVGDSEIDSDDNQTLTITSEDDLDDDGNRVSDNKIIKIYSVPFIESISLDDSAEGALSLIYQGVFSERLEFPVVEIIKGHGSLSDPAYGSLVGDYIHTDLGAITVSENGNITTEVEGQSLIDLSYATKYHKYVVVRNSDDKYLQVWLEVEE